MANYIRNTVNIYGENHRKEELKKFLIKYSEVVANERYIDLENSTLEDKCVLFDYSWNDIGSRFFDIEKLEADTLYFKTQWVSALSVIVGVSKLFSDIEFHHQWQPLKFGDLDFGVATIKLGEILSLSNKIPQEYLEGIEECLMESDDFNIKNDKKHSKELILTDGLPF